MNIGSLSQLSTSLNNQRIAAQAEVAVVKLTNDNIEAQGQAAIQLIQSVPQPQGNVGNNINIKV
jgi:hypothetical protein